MVIFFAGTLTPVFAWTRNHIQELGVPGVILFVVLYSVVTLLMIPVLPMTLLAGLVYGIWGFPLAMMSAILAACLAFLLARSLLHTYVSTLMKRNIIFLAIKRAVTEEQWKVVIFLRMSPMLSFAMQNYLLAVTDIRFLPYAIGSALGMTPAIAIQVYLGSLGSLAEDGSLHRGFLAAGAAASVTVILLISYRTKKAIAQIKSEYRSRL